MSKGYILLPLQQVLQQVFEFFFSVCFLLRCEPVSPVECVSVRV